MKKTIEVTITLTSEDEFTLDFYEPESGDHCRIEGDDSYDGSLTDRVGSELLSWVDLMREEQNNKTESEEESLEVCPVCGAAIAPIDGEEDGYGMLTLCWECSECGTSGYAEIDMQNGNEFIGHTY